MGNWAVGIGTLALYLLDLVVLCIAIARPHRTPASRVAWTAIILLLPALGIAAYLLLGETNIGRGRLARLREAERSIPRPQPPHTPPTLDPTTRSAFDLAESINGFAATAGNAVTLSPSADAVIAELTADIDEAVDSVHICFYIWLDDQAGTAIAEAVSRAARRGVTCRVMVDALGSRKFVRSPAWQQMTGAGAQCVSALNDLPRIGKLAVGRLDLRNHQKIVVIDDQIAYCGSRNCADPAFLPKATFAPWVDVFFRVQGPAVAQQQWLFTTAWMVETGERVTPQSVSTAPEGADAVAVAFGTGPTKPGAMSSAFVTTIATARTQLTITTPYFAPDEPLLQAICSASRRGVTTTLVLPTHNDSRLVAATARSYYDALLSAGVQLYEYPLGLLHSKTITIDDRLALVGSANMDRRSLELNDENNLLVDSPTLAAAVLERQRDYLAAARRITEADVAAWPFWRRLVDNTVAMLSPIL